MAWDGTRRAREKALREQGKAIRITYLEIFRGLSKRLLIEDVGGWRSISSPCMFNRLGENTETENFLRAMVVNISL